MVKKSDFLDLNPGLTVDQVEARLGAEGDHQFTALIKNGRYMLLSYRVQLTSQQKNGGAMFWLLFKNGRLDQVTEWVKPEMEQYMYNGVPASRRKSVPVTDDSRIRETIEGKALSRDEIEAYVKKLATRKRPEEMSVLPALRTIINDEWVEKVREDYERNRELKEELDGKKVSIAMTELEVEAELGKSTKEATVDKGMILRIYGESVPLTVNPLHKYSRVAVLFENGKAIRVLSNQFFNEE